ncbi:hypothetical protein SARC_15532, partial [Sphaeroforma arctica JP610]
MNSLAISLAQFRPNLLRPCLFVDDTRIQTLRSVRLQVSLNAIDDWGRQFGLEQGSLKPGSLKPRKKSSSILHAVPPLRIKGDLISPALVDSPNTDAYLFLPCPDTFK